jgi:hypothetical protein
LKTEDKNYETKIIIEKGLKPEAGKNVIDEPITSNLMIPSPYVLNIQNIESDHDGVEGTVRVITSQQLSPENLKSFVKVELIQPYKNTGSATKRPELIEWRRR